MSLGKFNAHRDIRIDRVKAHHSYLRPKKEKPMSRDTTDYEGDYDKQCAAPWEITNVKGLCAGKPKNKLEREKIFDINNDGKPFKKKKEPKSERLARAFVMLDSKKFHEIDGRFIQAPL